MKIHAWRDAFGLMLLTLVLLALGSLVAEPHQRITADSPTFTRALVRFHALEQNATDSYRWSQPWAALFLYGFEGRPAIVALRLAAPRPPTEPLAALRLTAANQVVGSFTLDDRWRLYYVLSPTRATGETALRFETSPFVSDDDPREKGVALSLAATRLAASAGLPPVRAIFLLSLPLLAWLLALRLGGSRWVALSAGLALALVAGWAAAWPSAAGYWLPTLGWPWWPVVPLLLLGMAPWWQHGLHLGRQQLAAQPK